MSSITNEYLGNPAVFDATIIKESPTNQSVFSAALPYAVGSLLLGGAGTWVAVTQYSSAMTGAAMILPAIAATVALVGFIAFSATAIVGIYSRDSNDFYQKIGPALKIATIAAMTEVMAIAARTVLERIIEKVFFNRR